MHLNGPLNCFHLDYDRLDLLLFVTQLLFIHVNMDDLLIKLLLYSIIYRVKI